MPTDKQKNVIERARKKRAHIVVAARPGETRAQALSRTDLKEALRRSVMIERGDDLLIREGKRRARTWRREQ